MAKIKRRGESGAAKNYVTRNQALKKLQISLSDFRRLCILKGIYPRDPVNKKRANKGSSAPASFYYHKDIQYLLHEPLLVKFREHKAFAKKLARAVGRQEWGLAKNLEAAKPVFRLDHLVKERYPTFQLALQDLQDPLNLVHLFSNLPTNPIPGKTLVPVDIIQGCTRLIAEWKLWALKTHSLRKVFLGIKGIYYECLVPPSSASSDPVPVRWLEGYEFQQHVPHDVDFRILLTFIDLYRTLISFVLYKLYTQENLVYPPPLDQESDERGEGVGAYRLVEKVSEQGASGQGVSKKEVKRAINSIRAGGAAAAEEDVDMADETEAAPQEDEEFVERPSKGETDDVASAPLTTYSNLLASSSTPSTSQNLLFSSYTFYLSREISSKTWEFIIRSQGGKIITAVQAPEPSEAKDANSITHVVCDRPMTTERMRSMEGGRKWVWIQPQWIADSINRQKAIGHEEYAPGALLPPHLSPWDGEGELERPWLGIQETAAAAAGETAAEPEAEEESEDEEDEAEEVEAEDNEAEGDEAPARPALLAAAADASDPALVHAAELEAEALSIPHAKFEAELKALAKQHKATAKPAAAVQKGDEDLRKIMMSNKKAKLYEKMQYGNRERAAEKEKLEKRRQQIEKRKAKEAGRAGKA